MESGVLGYERRIRKHGGIIHRKCSDSKLERADRKLNGNTTWFKPQTNTQKDNRNTTTSKQQRKKVKQKDKNKQKKRNITTKTPAAILFVPRTKGGELATLIRAAEEDLSRNSLQTIKVIERNGDKLENILVRKDPVGDEKCEEEGCLICLTQEKEGGTCRKPNVVYKISCNTCKTKGEECNY